MSVSRGDVVYLAHEIRDNPAIHQHTATAAMTTTDISLLKGASSGRGEGEVIRQQGIGIDALSSPPYLWKLLPL